MRSVAIIGAGITGLTAGFYLSRQGVPVTIYEAGNRVGGVIQSFRQGGYLAESGPNTILEASPRIIQLVKDAGLAARRLDPDPSARARYLVRGRQPVAMPGSLAAFLTTSLFSLSAKLALLREPFIPARPSAPEESVADFVQRRLGTEFLDRAVDGLVAGIYAGDPRRLSLTHAFPRLAALEARYGSLIKGQILGARERRQRNEVSKNRAPSFSFDEGLQVLTDTLGGHLRESVRLGTSVTGISRSEAGWRVETRHESEAQGLLHQAVIFAGTAFKLAELKIHAPQALALAQFDEIRYPPVASVVLGFRREDVAHPCAGFGMLIPKIEGFRILGTIFSSSLFPNRAPAGHVTLSSYVGGERCPELAKLPPDELVRLTCEDLRTILGVSGQPTFRHTAFYPRAIPQYNVGYGRFRDRMTELEVQAPGLFLAGHYRDGVSLSDSILSGCNAVERVERYLATGSTSDRRSAPTSSSVHSHTA